MGEGVVGKGGIEMGSGEWGKGRATTSDVANKVL